MKLTRNASAEWLGGGSDGKGTLTTQSKTLDNTQYSFKSRFESGTGTNPEELVAAAHSGCFSMKLSFVIGEMGFKPESINTDCKITFEDGKIVNSHLDVKVKAPGMSPEQFAEAAENAKTNCPISLLLNTNITMNAELIG